MSKKHRIGFDLDAPLKFFGMTKDEGVILLLGFMAFLMSTHKHLGLLLMVGFLVLVVALKRFKKRTKGFRIKSFLNWHTGYLNRKITLPPSSTRHFN